MTEKEDYPLGAYAIAFPLAFVWGFVSKVLDGIALTLGFWIAYKYILGGVIL